MKVQGGVPEDAVWSGEWKRLSDIFNSATLFDLQRVGAGFDFQLDAFNGSHMGFLSGTAAITGDDGALQGRSAPARSSPSALKAGTLR